MKALKRLMALFVIQALLAACWTFITPSESGSAVLLWLSRERLLLLGVTLAVWAVLVIIALWLWRSPVLMESVAARLELPSGWVAKRLDGLRAGPAPSRSSGDGFAFLAVFTSEVGFLTMRV